MAGVNTEMAKALADMTLDSTVAINMSIEERADYEHNPRLARSEDRDAFRTHASVAAPVFAGEVHARTLLSTLINADGEGTAHVNFQTSAEE
eukprot:4882187-Prorocentrum_lima.AAC.1